MDLELEATACPWCGESVQSRAIRCRHCSEYLAAEPPAARDPDGGGVEAGFPLYSKIVYLLDLACCGLRLLLVVVSLAFALGPAAPGLVSGIAVLEIGTGVAIVLLGIPADVLLLRRHPGALVLGWGSVAAMLASVAVGVWQGVIQIGWFQPGSVEYAAGIAAAVVVVVIRLAIIGLYAAALVQTRRWLARTGG